MGGAAAIEGNFRRRVQSTGYKEKICGDIEKTATECDGGKDEDSRQMASFCGVKMAGGTRAATVLTQTRRKCGSDLPLRKIDICMAGTRERTAANAKRSAEF
jgi:hypothetical protein